jgi:hypothetical protein
VLDEKKSVDIDSSHTHNRTASTPVPMTQRKEPIPMKYLCLCYYDTEKFAQLSQAERDAIGPACKPHDAVLRATGKVVVQGSLADPQDWKTIRPVNGTPVVTKGPLLDATQLAGAFIIVEADTIDEARRSKLWRACGHGG